MTEGDPYVYTGTYVLRNRLEITNPKTLDRVERRIVAQKTRRGVPEGKFDLAHLQAIHRHLFQDMAARRSNISSSWLRMLVTISISRALIPWAGSMRRRQATRWIIR